MDEFESFIKVFRKQRHDFMNDLQVVFGYMQIEKDNEAKVYIKNLIEQNRKISKIYSLGDDILGFFLERKIKELHSKGIEIDIDFEIYSFSKHVFKNKYDKKCDLVNNIFSDIENNNNDFVYIYFFEDEQGESMLIANDESCVYELDCMEEWKNISCGIDDIELYKYESIDCRAFRITFK